MILKLLAGGILLALGILLLYLGASKLRILRRFSETVNGRYMDSESVSSFRGEKFRLRFEYDFGGRTFSSLSDGKFKADEIVSRGFLRGRRYELLVSPGDPGKCTCRMKNEYVFESTVLLLAGFFASAIGVLFFI